MKSLKSLQVLGRQALLRATAIALLVATLYGTGYGVNKLGGLLFRNEALVCLKSKSRSSRRLNSVVIPTEGTSFITGGNYIKFWDADTGKRTFSSSGSLQNILVDRFKGKPRITALTLTPDQTTLISAQVSTTLTDAIETIQIWDLATHQEIHTFTVKGARIHFLTVSPDGQTLLGRDISGVINLWDITTGKLQQAIDTRRSNPFEEAPEAPAFNPDGTVFTSIFWETITFWDVATGESIGTMTADPLHTPLAISADNKNLLIQNAGDVKRFRDVATGQDLLTLHGSEFQDPFAVISDGEEVLIQTDSGMKRYDFLTGTEIQHLPQIERAAKIIPSPDGASFLTLDRRGRYTLWDLETGAKIHALEGRTGLGAGAVTSDSQTLVHVNRSGNHITQWDLTTGQRIRRFCNY